MSNIKPLKKLFDKRKVLFLILMVIIVITILIILFPDCLIFIRQLLKKINFLDIITNNNLSNEEYAKIMMSSILSSVAIAISICAYVATKKPHNAQLESRSEEVLISTFFMKNTITKTCKSFYDISKNSENVNNIKINNEYLKHVSRLKIAGIINYEQSELLIEFNNYIIQYADSRDIGDPIMLKQQETSFLQRFFKNNSIDLIDELKCIIDELEKQAKGEK